MPSTDFSAYIRGGVRARGLNGCERAGKGSKLSPTMQGKGGLLLHPVIYHSYGGTFFFAAEMLSELNLSISIKKQPACA